MERETTTTTTQRVSVGNRRNVLAGWLATLTVVVVTVTVTAVVIVTVCVAAGEEKRGEREQQEN